MSYPFNVKNTGLDLTTFFKSGSQTGPPIGTGYKKNSRDISNDFTLYMFGTKQLCNYQYKNVDLANYYQPSSSSPTFIDNYKLYNDSSVSTYGWLISDTTAFGSSYWLWPVSFTSSTNYWFYYTFYYSGSNTNKANIYLLGSGTLYFNSNSISFNSYTTRVLNNTYNLNTGLNYLVISANYNPSSTSTITTVNGTSSTPSNSPGYTLYTFSSTATSSITFSNNVTGVTILLVGGGGYGGVSGLTSSGAGGGGSGGVYYNNNITINSGTYTVTVGVKGIPLGGTYNGTSGPVQATASSFHTYSASGGRNGSTSTGSGAAGGNSGSSTTIGISNGGAGVSVTRGAGGGGGGVANAGSAGSAGGTGGAGGGGYSSNITGTTIIYGGGGGGGSIRQTGGIGGAGGGTGGAGGNYGGTGGGSDGGIGGGGGGATSGTTSGGGYGGNGIVFILVPNSTSYSGVVCNVTDGTNSVATTNNNWAYSSSQQTANYNNV